MWPPPSQFCLEGAWGSKSWSRLTFRGPQDAIMRTRNWPRGPAHLVSLPQGWVPHSVMGMQKFPAPASYLDGCHANLPPDQDPAVLERGHVGFLQLHEVCNQVGDVELPVGTEQVAWPAPGAGALRHKLREDPHGGVLVLQGAASAPPLLLILILAVSRGPGGKREEALRSGDGIQDALEPRGRCPHQPPRDSIPGRSLRTTQEHQLYHRAAQRVKHLSLSFLIMQRSKLYCTCQRRKVRLN